MLGVREDVNSSRLRVYKILFPLILRSHEHFDTVRYGLEQFGTVTVLRVNRYRTVLNHTVLARFLLLCCTVWYGSVRSYEQELD